MTRALILMFSLSLCLLPVACTNTSSSPSPVAPSNGGPSLSTDGTNWIFATVNAAFPSRENHTSLVFNDKIWVIGGYNGGYLNDTWYSTDGATWFQAAPNAAPSSFPSRSGHTSVVFNSAMWVIGGVNGSAQNDTWSSLDGLHWNQGTNGASNSFTARYNHASLLFSNKLWVFGGHGGSGAVNDTWSSSDGVTWAQVNNGFSNSFTNRYFHTALSFNGRMWVLGGDDGSGNQLNDVWSSPDGILWTQVAANNSASSFPARESHSSVVFDNAMWVMGGLGVNGFLNDAWYSTDGAHWSQANIQTQFLARLNHTSVVFNNAMWIIAGLENGAFLNDAWHSP